MTSSTQTTRDWMKRLGYRGILDIGYRYDARDGSYKVLDVNPRIGATFRLFVAKNGMDVARALYLDLTGQAVPAAEQVDGRKWLVELGDVDSFLRYRRDGKLTTRQWIASMAGVQESAFFAPGRPETVPGRPLGIRPPQGRDRIDEPKVDGSDRGSGVREHRSRYGDRYWGTWA